MMWSPVKLAVGEDEVASNDARLVELTELELSSSSTLIIAWMPLTVIKLKQTN